MAGLVGEWLMGEGEAEKKVSCKSLCTMSKSLISKHN